jgi:hypothetical protein
MTGEGAGQLSDAAASGNGGQPPDIAAMAAAIERARAASEVPWRTLLELGHWRTYDDPADRVRRDFADRHYAELIEIFRAQHGGNVEVVVFGGIGGGTYLLPSGYVEITVSANLVSFDWSLAHPLGHRISAFAEEVVDWWREDDVGDTPEKSSRRRRRLRARMVAERRPHSQRAFNLATVFLSAITDENARHLADSAAGTGPSPRLVADVGLLERQLAEAEEAFELAAQRNAQIRYARGMVVGMTSLAVVYAALAAVFALTDTPLAYAIAGLTGGVGAVVSVLQRMTANRVQIDFRAAGELIEAFGALRPFVGAVFGLALFALVESGLLSIVDVASGEQLAFYALVGFLAGFNERFAQDMLAGSARGLAGGGFPPDAAPTASHP